MGTLLKFGFALCIGWALWAGAQHLWLSSVAQRVAVQSQQQALPQFSPVVPAMNAADAQRLRDSLTQKLPPIDSASAQRAATIGLGQRIDIQNRISQSYVPLPNGSLGH